MAAKTFYLLNAKNSGVENMQLQDGGSPPSQARIVTGWIVGTVAAVKYALMDSATERASSALGTTVLPNAGPDNTLGDSFRSINPINGQFANANWSLSFQVEGETRSTSTTDGRLRIRIWKSANSDGSSPTELTSATLTTTQFIDLANSAFQTLTVTWSPGIIQTLTNEYLFIQIALQLDGAGNNANADVHLAVGSSNSIITSDFTPAADVLTANNLVSGAPVLGTSTLGIKHNLTASNLVGGTPTFGTQALGVVHNLTASNLASSTPVLGIPTLAQVHILTATAVATGDPALSTPAIGQIHTLSAESLVGGAPVLGTPVLASVHTLAATGLVAGALILGSPSICQQHVLTSMGLAVGTPALGTPSIQQAHALSAEGMLAGAPTLGMPTLTENEVGGDHLTANDLTAGTPAIGIPVIGQVHQLTAGSIAASAPYIGTPAIGQIHLLVAVILAVGAPALGRPILSGAITAVNLSLWEGSAEVTLWERSTGLTLQTRTAALTLEEK